MKDIQFGEPEDEEEEPYVVAHSSYPISVIQKLHPSRGTVCGNGLTNLGYLKEAADDCIARITDSLTMGDWAYSRIAQPAASPIGVATLPIAVNPIGRAALAGIGTVAGASTLPGGCKRRHRKILH